MFINRTGEGAFAYFCCRAKVWRMAGRDPPILVLLVNEQTIKTVARFL
jgi:hypothetical protein